MTQKKKIPTPASHLIDSMLDDLKDVGEGSVSQKKSAFEDENSEFLEAAAPIHQADDPNKTLALPQANVELKKLQPQAPSWDNLQRGSVDNQLQQAENLSLAQNRILDLERQLNLIQIENDQLNSRMDVARSRLEETTAKLNVIEKNKLESKEQSAIEQAIFRENIQARDYQVDRLKQKVAELEHQLQGDMKKIRVRERELENRLELSKAEKTALIRSKDETILGLKRKIDQMTSELDESTGKCQDLVQKVEANQEQFSRTVRALRLALTNLEVHESTSSVSLSHLKKAD